ncbi:hypothetical protein HNP82_003583, partial [Catenibacillus scindens]|nr:hypothetical protein [Catenibacillus scindens]
MSSNKIYFSDFFKIDSKLLEEYGAFNVSLVNDLPLFIDPFLIFCNEETECQEMHDEIIKYLIYLRDRAAVEEFPSDGVLQTATFCGQQGHISRTVRAILSGQFVETAGRG